MEVTEKLLGVLIVLMVLSKKDEFPASIEVQLAVFVGSLLKCLFIE